MAEPRTPTHTTSDDVRVIYNSDGDPGYARRLIAPIRNVFDDYAAHINRAGENCCRGCTLARQIPTLIEVIEGLCAAVDAARADGEHAATARIVAGLRDEAERLERRAAEAGVVTADALTYRYAADLIERGEFDGLAARS